MLKLGLTCFCVLLLTGLCWLGGNTPTLAQPQSTVFSTVLPLTSVPIAQTNMAKKSLFSFSGTRPTHLGVKDGKLAVCPGTPNCVNSQAPDSDLEHKIAPLAYTTSPSEAMTKLKSVIEGMERTEVITAEDNYLYAEFTSALMGYVDDVEFYLDPDASVIQVRSASRLGQSDLGVNRKRVEAIRAKLAELNA